MNLKGFLCSVPMVLIPVGSLFSFVYEIQVMRFWNKDHAAYQYLIACSDFHDTQLDIICDQRSELLALLGGSSADRVSVILEDLHSPNTGGAQRCAGYRLRSSCGLLSGLTKACQVLGLEVANLEYRYARAISLGGIIPSNKSVVDHYKPARDIQVKRLLDEIDKAMHEVMRYADGARLTRYYSDICNQIIRHRLFMSLKKEKVSSVAEFYERLAVSHGSSILKQLLTFDSPLLDCKLAHHVFNTNRSRVVLLIAGGVHIDHVCAILSREGYELIEKVSNAHGLSMANAVAAQIACGGFVGRKPRPVSLYLVEKYLHK